MHSNSVETTMPTAGSACEGLLCLCHLPLIGKALLEADSYAPVQHNMILCNLS